MVPAVREDLLEQPLNLEVQIGMSRIIGDDKIGFLAFPIQWLLKVFYVGCSLFAPVAFGLEPLPSALGVGVDEDDDVAPRILTDFKQQGHIEDHGGHPGVLGQLGQEGLFLPGNAGMQQIRELFELTFVGKNDPPECFSVDLPGRV